MLVGLQHWVGYSLQAWSWEGKAHRYRLLMVQEAVNSGRIALGKKPTVDMLADMLTSPSTKAEYECCLSA